MSNSNFALNSIMNNINGFKISSIKINTNQRNYEQITKEEQDYIKENLGKFPFRGSISAIAKERGVTRAAIYKSIMKHNNLYYLSQIKRMTDEKMSNVL